MDKANSEKMYEIYFNLKNVEKKFLNEEGLLTLNILEELFENKSLNEKIKNNLDAININSILFEEIQEDIIKIFIKKGLKLEKALVILERIPNFLISNSKLEIMS